MNELEVGVLMKVIGDVKRIEFDDDQRASWHLILADTDLEDAKTVVVAFLRDRPGDWMEAGHIHQGVKEIQTRRLRRYGTLVPEELWPELSDEQDAMVILAKTRELAALVRSGKIVRDRDGRPELPA